MFPSAANDSLAAVGIAGIRARYTELRRSSAWRRVMAWCAEPLVASRGRVLVASALIASLTSVILLERRAPDTTTSPDTAFPPTLARAVVSGRIALRRAALPAAPASDAPRVVGIVGRLPGDAVVLVRDKDGAHAVAVGGFHGDWRLVELSATEAVFARDGARRTVELPAAE